MGRARPDPSHARCARPAGGSGAGREARRRASPVCGAVAIPDAGRPGRSAPAARGAAAPGRPGGRAGADARHDAGQARDDRHRDRARPAVALPQPPRRLPQREAHRGADGGGDGDGGGGDRHVPRGVHRTAHAQHRGHHRRRERPHPLPVVQPALPGEAAARGGARRHRRQGGRLPPAPAVRLPRVGAPRRGRGDARGPLRAHLPAHARPARSHDAPAGAGGRRSLPAAAAGIAAAGRDRRDRLPAGSRRHPRPALPRVDGRPRGRPRATRLPGVARDSVGRRAAQAPRPGPGRRPADPHVGRVPAAVRRRAAVPAHQRADARHHGAAAGPGAAGADGPPAAGGRGLRQDRGRRGGDAGGRRAGPSGRAHGAHRDPGRAALPDLRAHLRRRRGGVGLPQLHGRAGAGTAGADGHPDRQHAGAAASARSCRPSTTASSTSWWGRTR